MNDNGHRKTSYRELSLQINKGKIKPIVIYFNHFALFYFYQIKIIIKSLKNINDLYSYCKK